MSKDNLGYGRGGAGVPWPINPRSAQVGEKCTLIGSGAIFGTVVMTGATVADALLDGNQIAGPTSPMRVVELPTLTPDANVIYYGFYGVVQSDEAVIEDAECPVNFGPCTQLIRVYDASATSYVTGQGLEIAYGGLAGSLVLPVPTGSNSKLVGRVAKAYTGLTAGENLLWVHFDGIHGWGNVNTTA